MRLYGMILALALASPALGQDDPLATFQENVRIMSLASNLGTLIGSESFCGLTFDQSAISAWITSNVPADRMDFPESLQMTILGEAGFQADMTASAKTAHCTAVSQSARHLGFITP